nr:MAG TPA: hypothetical protein [Caudoviricetes sp.]
MMSLAVSFTAIILNIKFREIAFTTVQYGVGISTV